MMNALYSLLPLGLAAAIALVGASPVLAQTAPPPPHQSSERHRVSGPFTHDNLSVYLIHGASSDGPVPLTLDEALAKKLFQVRETGNVQSLAIENLSEEAVFLQAGDIVKGGQQDRVLTVSVLVPPRSGRMAISAYCVEQGRWAKRGTESATTFDSASASVPSKRAKLAMMARSASTAGPLQEAIGATGGISADGLQRLGRMAENNRTRAGGAVARGDRQFEMWASVAETQERLSANLGAEVAAPQSASSLQLALENEKLTQARTAYITALSVPAKDADDVIGFAFAVNGRINSADVYHSHALFAKMWGKLITAAATEALSAKADGMAVVIPTMDQIQTFLVTTDTAAPDEHRIDQATLRITRQNETAVAAETRGSTDIMLHRSIVAF